MGRKGPRGNANCWSGAYTFETCCSKQAIESATNFQEMCWYDIFTPRTCCDRSKGPRGDGACWDKTFTFERCCPAPLIRQLEAEAIRETCWTSAVTPGMCCDLRKGVHGDSGCWNGPYTFDICCPNEAKLSSDFRKSCWLGGVSEELCCDTRISPRGDTACW